MVHYAGVCCNADVIDSIARRHSLVVIEDAAQAYLSTYRGRQAGSLGSMACFSFHETKNLGCGEGGAFVTDSSEIRGNAEILREKGTDRSRFLRGDIDKYSWIDYGSSYLPSEFASAVLFAQLEHADRITTHRLSIWNRFHEGLTELEALGLLERPTIPSDCTHNAQIYRIMLADEEKRNAVMRSLRARGIGAAFHFLPLHLSQAGRKYGRFAAQDLAVTTSAASRLLRLPIHGRMSDEDVEWVLEQVRDSVGPERAQ
jgi:dTDP-4-amino-4,6-dideoxygalactose transaminase